MKKHFAWMLVVQQTGVRVLTLQWILNSISSSSNINVGGGAGGDGVWRGCE